MQFNIDIGTQNEAKKVELIAAGLKYPEFVNDGTGPKVPNPQPKAEYIHDWLVGELKRALEHGAKKEKDKDVKNAIVKAKADAKKEKDKHIDDITKI